MSSTSRMPGPIRHAWRRLLQHLGSSVVAVLTLGVALALATTTFAVLDAATHPFVPYRAPERLLSITREGGSATMPGAPELLQLVREGTSFHAGVALVAEAPATLVAGSDVRQVTAAVVSPDLFAVLGVEHALGRFSGRPARLVEGTAVVSERVWRRLFPAGSSLEGASIRLDDRVYPVVGVAPRGFDVPWGGEVWLPAARGTIPGDRETRLTTLVARLDDLATPDRAERELAQLAARLEASYGRGPKPLRFRTRTLRPAPLHAYDDAERALAGAALLVLLIACANVANLLRVRGLARAREMAVRTALGATRGALARLLLAEAFWLASLGGAVGVLLAAWAIDLVAARLPRSLVAIGVVVPHLGARVLAFGVLATGAAVLLVGLMPAIRASGVAPDAALKDGGTAATRRTRGRYDAAATAQLALATVLAMGAVLLARSAAGFARFPFGFEAERLVELFVTRPFLAPGVPADTGATGHLVRRDAMLAHLGALPGVAAVAGVGPTRIDGWRISVEVPDGGERPEVPRGVLSVTPDFFRTLGVPVVRGRDFLPGDLAGAGAVIVDRAMAARLWPHGEAVGRLVKLGDERSRRPWLRVVGVVEDAHLAASFDAYFWHRGQIYAVVPGDSARLQFVLRASRDPARLALEARRAVQAVAPTGTIAFIRPFAATYAETLEALRFVALVFAVFAGFGAALAVLGLYGVVAVAVRERTRELAIRAALGATRSALRSLVLRDALVMALAGVALGGPAAMWGGRLLGPWLFGVAATDVWALVAAEALLLVAALAAASGPARRAARTPPSEVLRTS